MDGLVRRHQPGRPPTTAWEPDRLTHTFSMAAATKDATYVFTAPAHTGRDLDWTAFDLVAVGPGRQGGATVERKAVEVLPAPVRFPACRPSAGGRRATPSTSARSTPAPPTLPACSYCSSRSATAATASASPPAPPRNLRRGHVAGRDGRVRRPAHHPECRRGGLGAVHALASHRPGAAARPGPGPDGQRRPRRGDGGAEPASATSWPTSPGRWRTTGRAQPAALSSDRRPRRLRPARPANPATLSWRLADDPPPQWLPLLPEEHVDLGPVLHRSVLTDRPLYSRLAVELPELLADNLVPGQGIRLRRRYMLAFDRHGQPVLWARRERTPGTAEGTSGLAWDRVEVYPEPEAQ